MGIQSTCYITRDVAIYRIKEIADLVAEKNYRAIEEQSDEEDFDVAEFVHEWEPINVSNLENWSNRMLEDYMDAPFIRRSIFDNYLIDD